MPKHIGIVGCSPEGTALCYREIFRHAKRLLGDRGHPVVSIHNEPLERYVEAVLKDDWHTVGDLLTRSARFLAACGAEFCIVPDNLMQHGVHLAEGGSPIPWLTMTDLVTRAVECDRRQVVGLIGTKMVMYGSTYQTALGLKGVRVLIPEDTEAESLNSIIFRELVFGETRSESRAQVVEIVRRLAGRGCEAVVLGCSEAALVISAENSPVPVYDATDLLAEGAVRYAADLKGS
ncbi:MAG: amino acid racemase [Phycisphaeraceae bacterium]|nr:amino acid racemase [Phycisphaeraceae bacterium]MBX3407979.1 amino acid racemase [Phycisphaeraceae bacterium]